MSKKVETLTIKETLKLFSPIITPIIFWSSLVCFLNFGMGLPKVLQAVISIFYLIAIIFAVLCIEDNGF